MFVSIPFPTIRRSSSILFFVCCVLLSLHVLLSTSCVCVGVVRLPRVRSILREEEGKIARGREE